MKTVLSLGRPPMLAGLCAALLGTAAFAQQATYPVRSLTPEAALRPPARRSRRARRAATRSPSP